MSIGEMIAIATFAITICCFVWKAALMSADIRANKECVKSEHDRIDFYAEKYESEVEKLKDGAGDLNGVLTGLVNSVKVAHERIDKYASKHESEMSELREELNALCRTQARMEEKINSIYDLLNRRQ